MVEAAAFAAAAVAAVAAAAAGIPVVCGISRYVNIA